MMLGSDGGVYACVMWGDVVVVGSCWCTRRLADYLLFRLFFRPLLGKTTTVPVSEFFAFGGSADFASRFISSNIPLLAFASPRRP